MEMLVVDVVRMFVLVIQGIMVMCMLVPLRKVQPYTYTH